MDNIIILQYDALHWGTRKFNLTNIYKQINPHIILINGHDSKSSEIIKIASYTTYQAD